MVQIKSLKSRIHWLSVMLACNRPHNPIQIVEENLEWLSPKRLPDKMRLKYFLLRLEYVLRCLQIFYIISFLNAYLIH